MAYDLPVPGDRRLREYGLSSGGQIISHAGLIQPLIPPATSSPRLRVAAGNFNTRIRRAAIDEDFIATIGCALLD